MPISRPYRFYESGGIGVDASPRVVCTPRRIPVTPRYNPRTFSIVDELVEVPSPQESVADIDTTPYEDGVDVFEIFASRPAFVRDVANPELSVEREAIHLSDFYNNSGEDL